MTENKTLKNLVCLAATLAICGSFLGAAETATARSQDNRADSSWYIDFTYPTVELLPLTGYSVSGGYVVPKGNIKVGGGASASPFFTAGFAEARFFAGEVFNIPLKIKSNTFDRDALGSQFAQDIIDDILEIPDNYLSFTFGLASEWQTKGGFVLGTEWLGFEVGGSLPRIRLFHFTLGYSH